MLLQPQSHTLITLIYALMKKTYIYVYTCQKFIFSTPTLYLIDHPHQYFEIHVVHIPLYTVGA